MTLDDILDKYWDITGRPKGNYSISNVVIDLLNKNAKKKGFLGFEKDMNIIYTSKPFDRNQLIIYYNVFLAGAKWIADNYKPS